MGLLNTSEPEESAIQYDNRSFKSTIFLGPGAAITHELRIEPTVIRARHSLSGPFQCQLGYELTAQQARAMATYLKNATHILSSDCQDSNSNPFRDYPLGTVQATTIDGPIKNIIALDLPNDRVLLYHDTFGQFQPTPNHSLAIADARDLASLFDRAADVFESDKEPFIELAETDE